MVLGEAPGYHEEKQGQAFVGRAGQLLREILDDAGLDPSELYITNAVNCRPPENRTPKAKEYKACRYWLEKQIESVKPRFVLCLGNIPTKATLDVKKGIKSLRGKPVQKDGIWYLPTYHPAYILRDPSQRSALEADVRLLAEMIESGGLPQEEDLNWTVVDSWGVVEEMLNSLRGDVSFDIETNCLYPWDDEAIITAVGFGTEGKQWIIPFNHMDYHPWSNEQLSRILKKCSDRLRHCYTVAHNGKFDLVWLRKHFGVKWSLNFDTLLAHYILDENSRHALEYLAQLYFGAYDYKIEAQNASWSDLVPYLAKDLYYTRRLRAVLHRQLEREGDCKIVLENIIMPCVEMFTEAELVGVTVDLEQMSRAGTHLSAKLKLAKAKLETLAPGVNWNSPKQVGEVLFDREGIKPIEYTKTGAPSTAETVLKRIDHPVCEALLNHRNAVQRLGLYIKGWEPYITEVDIIHPSFNLGGTVTGRPSCEHPNLQQTDRDPEIRSMVTAPLGWELVEADLSQIELRIAAELSSEENMLNIFGSGKDIHWSTAIRELARGHGEAALVKKTALFRTDKDLDYLSSIEVLYEMGPKAAIAIEPRWKDLRYKAKAINFGYLYGMYPKGFRDYARNDYGLHLTLEQAKQSRSAYFDMYPGLEEWHEKVRRYVRRHGYVRSLSGRKRRLPAAQSMRQDGQRMAAERMAINSPVQSFGSDLNLMAALEIHSRFDRRLLKVIGTVHDSILMMIRTCMVRKFVPQILGIMSHPRLLDKMEIKLRVPLEAEAAIGPWGKGVDLESWCERQSS